MRVLLADASPANRRHIRGLLSALDVDTAETDSPDEALALVLSREVDAIVMDHVPPGNSRFAVSRALRIAAAGSGARFVVYTGHRFPWTRAEDVRASADAVLQLPVDARQLADALKGASA